MRVSFPNRFLRLLFSVGIVAAVVKVCVFAPHVGGNHRDAGAPPGRADHRQRVGTLGIDSGGGAAALLLDYFFCHHQGGV